MVAVSRLVIVLPLTPLVVGESFAVASWPLHITVLPPFATAAEPDDIADAMRTACAGLQPLAVVAGDDALFGRRENIAVTLIDDSPELLQLHRTLKTAMLPFAAVPDEPAFTGHGFRAHVTVKQAARVTRGERLTLSQIALVDMAPRAQASGRRVLAAVELR